MTYGALLKNWRESRGWSQARLAEELGISQQAVSDWETGAATHLHGSARRLLAALGAPVPEEVAS